MRQSTIFSLITCALTCACTVLFGQSKNTTVSFPTYNQIKPAGGEIMDYVRPDNQKGVIQQKVVLNLFDYPAGTVTYILNGKTATDEQQAKKLLSQTGIHILNFYIDKPTKEAKRTIYIDFTTDK